MTGFELSSYAGTPRFSWDANHDCVADVGGIARCTCIGGNRTRHFRRRRERYSHCSTGNGAVVLSPVLAGVCWRRNSVAVATS